VSDEEFSRQLQEFLRQEEQLQAKLTPQQRLERDVVASASFHKFLQSMLGQRPAGKTPQLHKN
jgi:cell fate (sporulation/competence/biofilm development) regulator YlbF (YheA/YmcA/DUF963 family)